MEMRGGVEIVTLLTLILVTRAWSQVVFRGSQCPDVTTVQNFEPTRYLGLWYEFAKYPNTFQWWGRCVTATYTDNSNGKIGVLNTMKGPLGIPWSIRGEGTPNDPSSSEAKYKIRFPTLGPFARPGNYWVLNTDYTTYAVVWSCSPGLGIHTELMWILTRDRSPLPEVIATALDKVIGQGLASKYLVPTIQNFC